jgi:hypothetical protein
LIREILVGTLVCNSTDVIKYLLGFGITASLFKTLEVAEHYAAASYCPGNTVDSKEMGKLVCEKSNNCHRVESALTSIVFGIKKYVESILKHQKAVANQ